MTKKATDQIVNKAKKLDLGDPQTTRWLAINLSKIQTSMNQNKFIEERTKNTFSKNTISMGSMIFFGYSPKTKTVLEFWDEFPIVIFMHRQPGGFLGVNFHYLPPMKRSLFLNEALKFVSDPNWHKNLNSKTSINLSYPILKMSASMKMYKHCIKRYYFNNIVTKVAKINPDEWKSVPFFPMDKFKGASRQDVWSLAR